VSLGQGMAEHVSDEMEIGGAVDFGDNEGV
jgi:hypothetical protein